MLGKAIAALLPKFDLARLLDTAGLPAFTPRAITTQVDLCEGVKRVRACGFAIDNEARMSSAADCAIKLQMVDLR